VCVPHARAQIFCNKNDLKEAKGSDRVKLLLQKEIDEMRKTRGTMSVADGDSISGGRVLGVQGKPFKFEDETGRNIAFSSGSAKSSAEGGIGSLLTFLETLA